MWVSFPPARLSGRVPIPVVWRLKAGKTQRPGEDWPLQHLFIPTGLKALCRTFNLQAAHQPHILQCRGLKGIISKCQCENMGDGAKDGCGLWVKRNVFLYRVNRRAFSFGRPLAPL